jgi:Collagen triple helix repeat (20 copies)
VADVDELLTRQDQQNKRVLRYMRYRLLGTWLAVALLAILTCAALVALGENARTDLEQTDDIAVLASDTADAAKEQSDNTVAYLRGDQGIPGVPGANGVDGTPGQPSSEPGPQGEAGPAGEPGSAGEPGRPGAFGPVGPAGIAGLDGPPGTPGTPGHIGEQGPEGPAGPQGEPGPQGPAGERGPQGDTGPAGPAGPPGPGSTPTTSVVFAATPNTPDEPKQVTAQCASGRVSGGGFAVSPSDPGIIVTASAPNANGWNATAEELSLPTATNWQLLVFAVCVS